MQLFVFFRDRLGLAFGPTHEITEFRADGEVYRDAAAGSLTSLVDRLTDPAGRLVGFLVWGVPFEAGVADALSALGPRPYLERALETREGRPMAFAVYLDGAPASEHESAGDQAFGGQYFVGPGGRFALSIDLAYLLDEAGGDADIATLRAAPVEWLTLTDVQVPAA